MEVLQQRTGSKEHQSESEVKSLSRVQLFATPWTVAHQAPLPMGFSRQEYWSELPFPSPGDLPDPGIKLRSPTLQADALTSEPPGKPSFFFKGVKMYTHIYSSIICRNQKMETTQTSTNKRTNKQYAVYAYN